VYSLFGCVLCGLLSDWRVPPTAPLGKAMSPFAKFPQLDRQSSSQSAPRWVAYHAPLLSLPCWLPWFSLKITDVIRPLALVVLYHIIILNHKYYCYIQCSESTSWHESDHSRCCLQTAGEIRCKNWHLNLLVIST
jgi:hypothetical protein